jgi:hypothetical protein
MSNQEGRDLGEGRPVAAVVTVGHILHEIARRASPQLRMPPVMS